MSDDTDDIMLQLLHAATQGSARSEEVLHEHEKHVAAIRSEMNAGVEGEPGDDDEDFLTDLRRKPNTADASSAKPSAAARSAPLVSATLADQLLRCSRTHNIFVAPRELAERKARWEQLPPTASLSQWLLEDEPFPIERLALLTEATQAQSYENGSLELPLASHIAATSIAKINQDKFNVSAWKALLDDIVELPLSKTRTVWRYACCVFPSAQSIVSRYLQLEMNLEKANSDLGSHHRSESDAILQRLRILDVFDAHLSQCVGTAALHVQFIKYARDVVGIDPVTFNEKCLQALDRIARCVDAEEIWNLYIRFYLGFARKQPKVIEEARALFHQMLSIPMHGLEAAREEYDAFENSLRGGDRRAKLDPKLEERFRRAAKSLFPGKAYLSSCVDVNYLPRPLRIDFEADGPGFPSTVSIHTADQSGAALFHQRDQAAQQEHESVSMWKAWTRILAEEADVERQGLTTTAHAHRFAAVLRMRLVYLRHLPCAWMELAEHYRRHRMLPQCDDMYRQAISRFPRHILLHLTYVDALSSDLLHLQDSAATRVATALPPGLEKGNNLLLSLLNNFSSRVKELLGFQKQRSSLPTAMVFPSNRFCDVFDDDSDPKHLTESERKAELDLLKKEMTLVVCHWMKWAKESLGDTGVSHMRAIARHCIEHFGMNRSPAFFARWVEYELRLVSPSLGSKEVAVGVFGSWARIVEQGYNHVRVILDSELNLAAAKTTGSTVSTAVQDLSHSFTVALTRCCDALATTQHRVSGDNDKRGVGQEDFPSIAVGVGFDTHFIAAAESLCLAYPTDAVARTVAESLLRIWMLHQALFDLTVNYCFDKVRGIKAITGPALKEWCRVRCLRIGTEYDADEGTLLHHTDLWAAPMKSLVADGNFIRRALQRTSVAKSAQSVLSASPTQNTMASLPVAVSWLRRLSGKPEGGALSTAFPDSTLAQLCEVPVNEIFLSKELLVESSETSHVDLITTQLPAHTASSVLSATEPNPANFSRMTQFPAAREPAAGKRPRERDDDEPPLSRRRTEANSTVNDDLKLELDEDVPPELAEFLGEDAKPIVVKSPLLFSFASTSSIGALNDPSTASLKKLIDGLPSRHGCEERFNPFMYHAEADESGERTLVSAKYLLDRLRELSVIGAQ